MVQIYLMARNFQCSPTEIMQLSIEDFETIGDIMRVDAQLQKQNHEQ